MSEDKEKSEIKEKPIKKADDNNAKSGENIAIIRVRGKVRVKDTVNDTLDMLKVYRRNYCTVIKRSPEVMGMIKKAKDFVTWGEINDETYNLLKEKRGEKSIDKESKESMKKFFRLNSPKGGFERKGIKTQFKSGGVIGYRGDKINELIKKMI